MHLAASLTSHPFALTSTAYAVIMIKISKCLKENRTPVLYARKIHIKYFRPLTRSSFIQVLCSFIFHISKLLLMPGPGVVFIEWTFPGRSLHGTLPGIGLLTRVVYNIFNHSPYYDNRPEDILYEKNANQFKARSTAVALDDLIPGIK